MAAAVQRQAHTGVGKAAVVVGAGPVGCATAAMLAQRGWKVDVFERRKELSAADAKGPRNWPLALSGRGMTTLKAAGFSLPQRVLFDGFQLNNHRLMLPGIGTSGHRSTLFNRQQLGADLYRLARDQQYPAPGSITWHWSHNFHSLDLKQQSITFDKQARSAEGANSTPDDEKNVHGGPGQRTSVQYDLLVGADGVGSAVREALQQALPGQLRTEELVMLQSKYKTFHNIPSDDAAAEVAMPGIAGHQPGQFIYTFKGSVGVASVAIWKQDDGTLSGLLSAVEKWDEASIRAAVADCVKGCPPEWLNSIVAQTKENGAQVPSYSLGRNMKISQFHGPNCVLLGDAAHPVTAYLGQGCNSALEDVRVFMSTLDTVGLEAAPAEYTRARLKDVQALHELEFCQLVMLHNHRGAPCIIKGRQRPPSFGEWLQANLLLMWTNMPALLANRLLPSLFPQPAFSYVLIRNPGLRYSQVLRRLRGRAALLLSAAVPVTAVMAKLMLSGFGLLRGMIQG